MSASEGSGSERGLKALLVRWRRRRGTTTPPLAEQPSQLAPSAIDPGVWARREAARQPDATALLTGTYVTDGRSLLRIEHIHTDPASGITFVELEDCMTIELSVCTAKSLASRPLRNVVPVDAPHRPDRTASEQSIRARGGRAAAPR